MLQSLWKRSAGFTLLEALVVLGIIAVGSAVVIPVSMRMVHNARGDSAVSMASTFLQSARNRAVAERRNIVISFPTLNTLRIQRIEVPSGTLTTLDTLTLEGDEQFFRATSIPDNPDAFGGSAAVNFTGAQPVMFTSDGSFIDSAGDVTNANIFIMRPNFPDTTRSITITGVTGFVRAWKWQGSVWME